MMRETVRIAIAIQLGTYLGLNLPFKVTPCTHWRRLVTFQYSNRLVKDPIRSRLFCLSHDFSLLTKANIRLIRCFLFITRFLL